MKTVIIVVGVLVGVILAIGLLIWLVGSRLPIDHTASRSIRLKKDMPTVYAVVRDFKDSATWRPDIKSIEVLEPNGGHYRFREEGPNDKITYEIVEDVPNDHIVTRIVDTDLGYSGSWRYQFSADGQGTVLRITENGEVSNVIFRFMSYYFFGHTATIDAYLIALAKRLGEDEIPEG
ncbi:MAG TPA: SRPBCC family protein [Pyrinomonadaceae bacterium]